MAKTVVTTSIFTKPNLDVGFRSQPEDYRLHVGKNYIFTGKIISRQESLSEDGLILTVITYWDSEESRSEYVNDPVIVEGWARQEEYNNSHGIIFKCITQEFEGSTLVTERLSYGSE